MVSKNPTEPFIRISHAVQEQLMVSNFTEQQRRLLDLIYRLSVACGKTSAYIPRQKDFEIVGVREFHVKAHLDALARDKVIFREGVLYSFNLNFDQWRVSRALNYSPEKLRELVHLNLSMANNPLLTENVSQLTEDVSQLTESVSPNDPQTYVLRKNAVPELASAKEPTTNNPPIRDKDDHSMVEGFLEILSKAPGWSFDKIQDSLWVREFLTDFPETDLIEMKACEEFYSAKAPEDKGQWKTRFRRWQKRERTWNKEKGDGSGKNNKGAGENAKARVTGSRSKEDFKTPWLQPK